MLLNISIAIVLALLTKYSDASMYSLCRKQADCAVNHCCAMKKTTGKFGFCMPARQLGEQCTPSYMYGISYVCGCTKGLTCAVVEKSRNNIAKHRCVQVLPEAMEYDEKIKKRLLNMTGKYTASDLMRLLKLYRNPRLRRT